MAPRIQAFVVVTSTFLALACAGSDDARPEPDAAPPVADTSMALDGASPGLDVTLDVAVPATFDDEDGDGLTGVEELAGWEIFVDFSGFSLQYADFLTRDLVTSDPQVADTDGDGLLDGEEFLLKTNPRAADTDGDGLSDFDEVRRWQTSPVSVDSDADSRDAGAPASQPPDPALFDGAELQLLPDPLDPSRVIPGPQATSPILKDSDGDGVDDREERRHPFRNPAIAELPSVHVASVDDIDIRLDVTYAETQGTAYTYGAKVATTETTVSTKTVAYSNTTWSSAKVEAAVSASIGVPLGVSISAGETTTTGMSQSKSVTIDASSSVAASASQSEFFKDSVGRTMTTSGGHISASVRVTNPTSIAYVIDGMGLTLRQAARPGGLPRTLGVLLPQAGFDGFGMAPYSESPVIPFFAEFDAGTLIDLMGSVDSLIVEPIGFQLSNADDTDFVFVTEEVVAVTGGLIIDDGTGESDAMRVAAAVDRDDAGAPAGYRLAHALEVLGRDWEVGVNSVTGRSVLASLDGLAYEVDDSAAPDLGDPEYPDGISPGSRTAVRFWSVLGASRSQPVDLERDFASLTILPGQELVLAYVTDLDRDGVIDRIEAMRGASEETVHSDGTEETPTGDGLSDFFEILVGWEVQVAPIDPFASPPEPYRVFSHPGRIDSDGDGWDDRAEYEAGTDPNLVDTDGDSIPDATDPEPLVFFNDAPTLLAVVVDQYLVATVTIDADDDQNNIDYITVDWGDELTIDRFEYRDQEIRSDLLFDAVHAYAVDGDYDVTVTVTDVFGLAVSETLPISVSKVPKGAVLHWDFDDPAAQGCYTTGPSADPVYTQLDRFGQPGVCYKTPATGQGSPWITVGNPASYETAFSWSLWIRLHGVSLSESNILMTIANYPMLARYAGFGPNNGKINMVFANVEYFFDDWNIPGVHTWEMFGDAHIPLATPNQPGGWHHIVASFQYIDSIMYWTVYINGVEDHSSAIVGFDYNPVVCHMYFAGAPFNGVSDPFNPCKQMPFGSNETKISYDDVRVYPRALTLPEVQALFAE